MSESILLTNSGDNTINFDSFSKALDQRLKKSACSYSWNTSTLVASCLDCQNFKDSVLCLNCFLNGNHENHSVFLRHAKIGTCDCGNPSLFKPSGFCKAHSEHFNNDELSKEEKVMYISIFYGLLNETISDTTTTATFDTTATILIWINKMVQLGDALRRCCALAFIKLDPLEKLILKVLQLGDSSKNALNNLIGSMSNDYLFLFYYSQSIILLYPSFIQRTISAFRDNQLDSMFNNFRITTSRFYIAFTPILGDVINSQNCIKTSIPNLLHKKVEWETIFFESVNPLIDEFQRDIRFVKYSSMQISRHLENMVYMAVKGIKCTYDKTRLTNFALNLTETLTKLNQSMIFKRSTKKKIDDLNQKCYISHGFHLFFVPLIQAFEEIHFKCDDVFIKLLEFIKAFDETCCSCLSKRGCIHTYFPIFQFATNCIAYKNSKLEKYILQMSNKHDVLIESMIQIPLKWLAISNLALFNFFVRNSDSFIVSAKATFHKINLPYILIPNFALVQRFFAINPNKNDFLFFVAKTFGLFSHSSIDEDTPTQNNLEFITLFFMCCLIFDRYCITEDFNGIKKMIVITYLKKNGSLTLNEIKDLLWQNSTHEKQFTQDILNYTTLAHTKQGSHFKLTSDLDWSPILPFIKITDLLEIFSKFNASNPDSLISFPEYTDLPNGLTLKGALESPILYAIMYHILSGIVAKESTMKESLQLVFNLIIRIYQMKVSRRKHFDLNKKPNKVKYIILDSLKLLSKYLPKSFTKFMYIQVKYKSRPYHSMIDMIKECGPLGINVLKRINIHVEIPEEVDQSIKMKNKLKAKALQQKFMSDFKKKQDSFITTQNDEVETNEECEVCHSVNEEDPVLVFPIFIFETVLPIIVNSYVEKKPFISANSIFGFHLCGHFFHKTCINDNTKRFFKCPIDMCARNNFLPKIDKKYDEPLTEKEEAANKEFITYNFRYETFETIIASFCGELSLLEVRHRSHPECLDKSTNFILFHYLFLAFWREFHEKYKDYVENDGANNDLEKTICIPDKLGSLLFRLIKKDNPPLGYNEEVCSLANTIDDVELKYQFLRRAALIQHFALDIPLSKSSFIDWDELLSFPELCDRYHIDIDDPAEIELPQYNFVSTPQKFFSFMSPPHSINMANDLNEIGICLLTGEIVNISKNIINSTGTSLHTHITSHLSNGFTVILHLSGSHSSIPFVYSKNSSPVRLKSFYVDSFGCEDEGIKSGNILSLSNEKLDNLNEATLSSDWIDHIEINQPPLINLL